MLSSKTNNLDIINILDINTYSDERSEFDNFKIHVNNTSNSSSSSKTNNSDVIEVIVNNSGD
ncbi:9558_t:CDS:1, partial [Dentiscutata erythropus]